jgi:alkylation response protein AidB-like acyl-CoA dehydrogenase
MVSFTPTEEQQQLIDTVRRYAERDVRPVAHEADEGGAFPASVIDKGWGIGLVPTAIPEELGGLGEMSALTGALAAEELAFGDLSAALAVLNPATFAYPVILYGTAEQRDVWLPAFLDAKAPRATAALLEPGIFFDIHALTTTAAAEGDKVRLNGVKAVVPGAQDADVMLVYARDSERGTVDAYLVQGGVDGLEVTGEEKLLGLRALPTARVALRDVRVDAACKLGGAVGADMPALIARMQVASASLAVGVARAASEYAREYAKQRHAFGAPIATKQAIAFMLAEMAIEVDAARLLAWEAAWLLDTDRDATRAAYLAKQYADKAVMQVADSGVQVLGGYGFIREYPAERWLRNARGFAALEGLAIV